MYSVREPFPSKATQASLVFGAIDAGHPLTLTAHMADNGVIFSDGMEDDFLAFNAGATATIGLAANKARLVVASVRSSGLKRGLMVVARSCLGAARVARLPEATAASTVAEIG